MLGLVSLVKCLPIGDATDDEFFLSEKWSKVNPKQYKQFLA